MKKPQGCPADGIEGFRLFMIGQKEKPVLKLSDDVKHRLSVLHSNTTKTGESNSLIRRTNINIPTNNLKSTSTF